MIPPADMWAWAPDAVSILGRFVMASTSVALMVAWGVKHLRQVANS